MNKFCFVDIMLSENLSQFDSLVRDEPGLRINLAAINDFILHVVLGSGDKPCMILMKMGVKRIKLDITFVHQNMHLDSSLAMMKRSPWSEERKAKRNSAFFRISVNFRLLFATYR